MTTRNNIWDKVFKNGPSKICERQPLKNLKWYVPYVGTRIYVRMEMMGKVSF